MVRGLTQSQLAKLLGFSSGGVALIEQGKRAVSMATLNAIAKALDLPPGCLAILGSRSGGKSKLLADFVESLKQAISKLIIAQSAMAAENQKNSSKKRTTKTVAKRRNHRAFRGRWHRCHTRRTSCQGQTSKPASHKVAAGR